MRTSLGHYFHDEGVIKIMELIRSRSFVLLFLFRLDKENTNRKTKQTRPSYSLNVRVADYEFVNERFERMNE